MLHKYTVSGFDDISDEFCSFVSVNLEYESPVSWKDEDIVRKPLIMKVCCWCTNIWSTIWSNMCWCPFNNRRYYLQNKTVVSVVQLKYCYYTLKNKAVVNICCLEPENGNSLVRCVNLVYNNNTHIQLFWHPAYSIITEVVA